MTGMGVLTIFFAGSPVAARERWTAGVLAVAGLITVGTMSVTNFQLDSDFKWLLSIPPLLWLIAVVHLIAGNRGNA